MIKDMAKEYGFNSEFPEPEHLEVMNSMVDGYISKIKKSVVSLGPSELREVAELNRALIGTVKNFYALKLSDMQLVLLKSAQEFQELTEKYRDLKKLAEEWLTERGET